MSKNRYEIVAKNEGEADVYFYGPISRWGDQVQSVNSFSSQIQSLEATGVKTVNLRVHSHGGDVFEGVAIFNAIVNSSIKFNAYVDGVAASMASVIVLACDKVYMSSNAFMMIHAPAGGAHGSAKDLRKYADLLEKVEGTLCDSYVAKTGKDKSYIQKWMDGDNWFTAQEALSEGLIDEIVDKKADKDRPVNYKELSPTAAYDYFITALLDEKQCITIPTSDMDKKLLITALGITSVSAEMSDADLLAGVKMHLVAQDDKIAELSAKATSLQKQLDEDTTLIQSLNEKITETFTASVKNYLDAAQNVSKKITAEQRSEFEKLCGTETGFESVKVLIDKMPARAKLSEQIKNQLETDPGDSKPKPKDLSGMVQARLQSVISR